MADALQITQTITFEPKRCWECGRHWAVEKGFGAGGTCPLCADRRISEADDRAAAAERSMRAVKGAAKRRSSKR